MTAKTTHPGSHIFRTLRAKFILLNMLLALLVIAGAFGSVCYFYYTANLDNVYLELDTVLSSLNVRREVDQGRAPGLINSDVELTARENTQTDDAAQRPSDSGAQGSSSGLGFLGTEGTTMGPVIGSAGRLGNIVIPVAVYAVDAQGAYEGIMTSTTAKIPASIAMRANREVMSSEEPKGYMSEFDLFFETVPYIEDPDIKLVAYADGSSVGEWTVLAGALAIIGLGALAVLFLINIFFSRWALRPAEQAMERQRQFTADASHELKTPLTVVIANMEILKAQPDAGVGEQMQWVDSTLIEAERMQLLVNDMLALSQEDNLSEKRHSGSREAKKDRIDFSDLIEGEMLQFESIAFEAGIDMDYFIDDRVFVRGDKERLGRMVAILLDNACKYAVAGDEPVETRSPHVEVSLSKKQDSGKRKGEAVFSVFNTGQTISEEDLPHIFDRFYRADKVRTASGSGYGLGLAIGQEIAHVHNGNITVESSIDRGTVFTVTLPLAE